MSVIHFEKCPVCSSEQIKPYLKATDWGYSGKPFEIYECKQCTFAFTQDIPDQTEIAQYYQHADYVSHTDTQEGLFFKIYHKVRAKMLRKKRLWVEKHSTKGRILDIGAGTGYFLNEMKQNAWEVLGFEPEATARSVAQSNFKIDLKSDLEKIVNTEKKFDALSMWHVLEHVHTLDTYFEYFNQLLNPKGKVFIAVPNYTSTDGQFYKENWAAWDVPKHLWHFSPQSLEKLAEKHHFQLEKKYALPFDAFYIALLSEKSFLGKIRATFIGSLSYVKAVFSVDKASSVLYVLKKKN